MLFSFPNSAGFPCHVAERCAGTGEGDQTKHAWSPYSPDLEQAPRWGTVKLTAPADTVTRVRRSQETDGKEGVDVKEEVTKYGPSHRSQCGK